MCFVICSLPSHNVCLYRSQLDKIIRFRYVALHRITASQFIRLKQPRSDCHTNQHKYYYTQNRSSIKQMIGPSDIFYFYRPDCISDRRFLIKFSKIICISGKLYIQCSCHRSFCLCRIRTCVITAVPPKNFPGIPAIKAAKICSQNHQSA